MDIPIPILKDSEDRFVRNSYYGGATDIYKCVVKLLHYIDVNSLYPHAMLSLMPLQLIEVIVNPVKLDLNNFFGFLRVEVTCPESCKRPMLPLRHEGKTIYPVGTWTGTYFSEELKAVLDLNLGYQFNILEAHRYSSGNIFDKFVNHFYEIKRNSSGSKKFISKLMLNCLYGMLFLRDREKNRFKRSGSCGHGELNYIISN